MSLNVDMNLLSGDIERIGYALTRDAETSAALRAGARPIEEEMLHNAQTDPVIQTGTLWKDIATGRIRTRGTRKSIDIGVHSGAAAYYAAWVEFGHGGPGPAPAHHYVIPAFDARQEEAYATMRQVLANAARL